MGNASSLLSRRCILRECVWDTRPDDDNRPVDEAVRASVHNALEPAVRDLLVAVSSGNGGEGIPMRARVRFTREFGHGPVEMRLKHAEEKVVDRDRLTIRLLEVCERAPPLPQLLATFTSHQERLYARRTRTSLTL